MTSVAKVEDPMGWNPCGNDGRIILRAEELTPDRVVHLRGKLEVEIEGGLIRFEIQEDEPPEVSMHHLFRWPRVHQDQWQIANVKREILTIRCSIQSVVLQ
jgi:hypothetical protein